jgi:hypothetical protein
MRFGLILFSLIVLASESVFPAAPLSFGPPKKDADGKFIYMSEYDAEKYCESLGSRLPTEFEFAQYAQSRGASIRESAFRELPASPEDWNHAAEYEAREAEMSKNRQDGYDAIFHLNSNNKASLDFYFNSSGYHSEFANSKEEVTFWTSTRTSIGNNPESHYGVWFSEWGYFYDGENRDCLHPARCIAK